MTGFASAKNFNRVFFEQNIYAPDAQVNMEALPLIFLIRLLPSSRSVDGSLKGYKSLFLQ